MENKRPLGLEEDLQFEKRSWIFQRAGWVLMILIMAAALLGLTGPGPFSSRTATDESGTIKIEYSKFLHYATPDIVQIHLSPAGESDEAVLFVSRSYVRDIRLDHIIPEPEKEVVEKDFIAYHFNKLSKSQPVLVTLHINPGVYGNQRPVFKCNQQQLILSQFIYP
jgi:hypothetical protein